MVKMKYKISFLVLGSLLLLGVVMGVLSAVELRKLGANNLETLDRKLREDFDTLSRYEVEMAVSVASSFYERRDELGEARARRLARDVIDEMRYGEDGYIFIYDSKGLTISLPDDSVEGTNRWDLQDKLGNYLIRDIIKAAKDGTHYTTYYYNKVGETEVSPKRAFNDYFEPWDWILGTGNYIDDIDKLVAEEQAGIDSIVRRTLLLVLLVDLVVIMGAFALAWLMGSRFARPVELLARDVTSVAEGDLTVEIDIRSSDETGVLSDAVGNMVKQLRGIVSGISGTALLINRHAQEVAEVSQQVASGANEQAASAEEISASMEELSSNIQQNTDNARESNTIVSRAADGTSSSGASVEEVVGSMKFISEKIGIIEDIARNTNLLALNAAIEAARAGEAGKGFAVVASEVRKLAENSQAAANDITQVSSDSVKKADETLEQMREILPLVKKSADIAEEIFAGSNEQARGAEQINTALLQMDQVIQANAASSEEIASMADQLKSQSTELTRMVGFFHTGESTDISPLSSGNAVRKAVPDRGKTPAAPPPAAEAGAAVQAIGSDGGSGISGSVSPDRASGEYDDEDFTTF
jgi:methyl-accepting chemotaxis protein